MFVVGKEKGFNFFIFTVNIIIQVHFSLSSNLQQAMTCCTPADWGILYMQVACFKEEYHGIGT